MKTSIAAVAVLLAIVGHVQPYDGSGEKTCQFNKLRTVKNFDPTVLKGKWYGRMTHLPPYYKNVVDEYYQAEYQTFRSVDKKKIQVLNINRTFIYKDGGCISEVDPFVISPAEGKMMANVYNKEAGVLSTRLLHVLALDAKRGLLAGYFEVLLNGKLSKSNSYVFVVGKNKNPVKLSGSVTKALKRLCGSKAASPNFFVKYKLDHSACCDKPCSSLFACYN